jgi:hypothetical protein
MLIFKENLKSMDNNEATDTDKGLGVAIALTVAGLLLLSATKLVGLSGWIMWLLYGIGFLLALLGVTAMSIEIPEYIKEVVRLKQ